MTMTAANKARRWLMKERITCAPVYFARSLGVLPVAIHDEAYAGCSTTVAADTNCASPERGFPRTDVHNLIAN